MWHSKSQNKYQIKLYFYVLCLIINTLHLWMSPASVVLEVEDLCTVERALEKTEKRQKGQDLRSTALLHTYSSAYNQYRGG